MKTLKESKYEEQKQYLYKIAEEQFGKAYFEKIEEILMKFEEFEEPKYDYSITTNNKGAFYANEK